MGTDEPQEGTYWERAVLRRWLVGERVDIRVVRRQVAALLEAVESQEGTSVLDSLLLKSTLALDIGEIANVVQAAWENEGTLRERLVKGYREIGGDYVFEEGTVEQEHPQERPERAAEATGGPRAIRWTGDNDEAVRGFLGARYEKIRGGLQDYGPRVVWFRNNDPHGYLSWARAGDWLIEAGGRITTVADEDYEGPR